MDRKQHDLDCLQLFLDRIRYFRESISLTDVANDPGYQSILKCEKILEEGSYSMTKAVSYLQGLLLNCALKPLDVENPLRVVKATITEPLGSSDTILRFTAGLVLGVHLDCTLENLDDTSDVFVMVINSDFFACRYFGLSSFQYFIHTLSLQLLPSNLIILQQRKSKETRENQ